MFKKIRDYKIIILKDNDFNIRELNIYKIFGLFVFLLVFFFSFIIISIYSTDIKKIISFSEIRRHQQNNSILEQKIIQQNNQIDILLNAVNSIKNRDENLRELLRLPSIDDDIRELGVGGGIDSIKDLNDLNYLLPNQFDLDILLKNIDFIERSINLENLSYEEIENKINENLDYFLHYPAIYPVSVGKKSLTSRYGYRSDPFTKKRRFHEGDDFSCKIGVPVIATANGVVKISKRYGSFGNYIEIDHGNGYVTAYGHLSKRIVKKGDKVVRGQEIGAVGNTGRSTAPHLHYEVQYNKKHVNPNKFYFEIET
tara:strand:+ start:52350 stop:53285 length:936 start_codon:yes stop_codon:yes gene_type:complete